MISEDQLIQEIREVIDSRKSIKRNNYLSIREVYQDDYNWPEIQSLKNEICLCIMYGFHQAAICLTNHLLESFIKFSLIYYESKLNKKDFDRDETFKLPTILEASNLKYYNKNLFDNINSALDFGLITEEEKEILQGFRKKFRNALSHADRDKIYEDEQIPIQEIRIDKNELKFSESILKKIFDLPFTNSITQIMFAEINSSNYLNELHKIILNVRRKLFESM